MEDAAPYQRQLNIVKEFLSRDNEEERSDEEVVRHLGTSIAALYSVPTAIYCFLRAQEKIPGIEVSFYFSTFFLFITVSVFQTDNIFRRTIQYAISLGGDTDTIASMAGSMAGAYLGINSINENMQKHCEFHEEMMELADNLFSVIED